MKKLGWGTEKVAKGSQTVNMVLSELYHCWAKSPRVRATEDKHLAGDAERR